MTPPAKSAARKFDSGSFTVSDGAWAIDILMAFAILGLLNMLALGYQSSMIFKARATESLWNIGTQRAALVEHFALTGEWLDSDVGLRQDVASASQSAAAQGGDPIDAQDRAMRGQLSHSVARKGPDSGGRASGGEARTTTGIVEGVIVSLGNYAGFDGVSMISLQPAVIEGPEQPVVMWLCGRSPVPAGWRSPLAEAPVNLPDELLFSNCRGRKSR